MKDAFESTEKELNRRRHIIAGLELKEAVTRASGVAATSLKRTHSAEVAKDKIVSFCREVSFEKANGLRSGWIGDRCSGNLHKVLLELVNSIMNFTFMTSLSLSLACLRFLVQPIRSHGIH